MLTDAIARAARDPAVLATVAAVLGTDGLVMWRPNLQVGTPNESGLWHTDIESWLWPTVTVVVGLAGCEPLNATRSIPRLASAAGPAVGRGRQHRRGHGPSGRPPPGPRCTDIASFASFGDATVYVFDARCRPAGATGRSEGRESLFLHYDRAADPRVPYMRDYEDRTWFDTPATYLPLTPTPHRRPPDRRQELRGHPPRLVAHPTDPRQSR